MGGRGENTSEIAVKRKKTCVFLFLPPGKQKCPALYCGVPCSDAHQHILKRCVPAHSDQVVPRSALTSPSTVLLPSDSLSSCSVSLATELRRSSLSRREVEASAASAACACELKDTGWNVLNSGTDFRFQVCGL